MDQEKVGQLIKSLRIKNKLSQKEFADKYGVTYQAVSKWETGKTIPDIVLLKQICDDYQIDINDLLNGKSNIKKSKSWILGVVLLCIACVLGIIYYRNNHKDDITLSSISSSCNDFIITGSVAYNTNKGVIGISGVEYCGSEFDKEYDKIECILSETSEGVSKELGRVESTSKSELKEFLNNVKFNVSNFVKSCKTYNDDNLALEIVLTNGNDTMIRHRVALKLNEVCDS